MKTVRIVLSVLVWLGMLAAEAFVALRLWGLKVLPPKYELLIGLVLLLAWLLVGLLFLSGNKAKTGKHPGLGRRIIAWILAAMVIGGCLYGAKAAEELDQTINKVTEETNVTSVVAVYVLRDDPAQTLEDAAEYTFGVTERYDTASVLTALADMRKALGSVKTDKYDTVVDIVDALYKGDVDAIVLNEVYPSILEDMDNYAHFSDETRIIYEIPIDKGAADRIPTEMPMPEDDDAQGPIENFQPVNVTQEPFVIYLSGSDTRSQMLTTSRSDVNILVIINPKSKQVLLLNTPRDYYVPNPAGGGALDKLTHCGIYGIGCSVGALSDLYSVPVNYFAQINFTGFETLIDAIGGITVYSDYDFTAGGYSFAQGENNLNGSEALWFVRERYSFESGDRQRGQNQMKVISAVIRKLSTRTIILKHSKILDSLQGMFVTNMSSDEISDLVKMQLSDGAEWNVKSFAVTGGDGREYTYSMPSMSAYVMYQDPALVDRASELVRRVIKGETLTDADVAR